MITGSEGFKRISLRVWALKDEIKQALKVHLESGQSKEDLSAIVQKFNESKVKDEAKLETPEEDGKQVVKAQDIYRAVALATETHDNVIYFFSTKSFLIGQSIVIEFQLAKKLSVRATVMWCNPFSRTNKIVSDEKYSYRVVAKYQFTEESELAPLKKFVQSINASSPPQSPMRTKKSEESEEKEAA